MSFQLASFQLPLLQALADKLAAVDTTGWQLVVTGHSLGAGAAALVALYAHNYFPRCAAVLDFFLDQTLTVAFAARGHLSQRLLLPACVRHRCLCTIWCLALCSQHATRSSAYFCDFPYFAAASRRQGEVLGI